MIVKILLRRMAFHYVQESRKDEHAGPSTAARTNQSQNFPFSQCAKEPARRGLRDAGILHKVGAGEYRIGENPIQSTKGVLVMSGSTPALAPFCATVHTVMIQLKRHAPFQLWRMRILSSLVQESAYCPGRLAARPDSLLELQRFGFAVYGQRCNLVKRHGRVLPHGRRRLAILPRSCDGSSQLVIAPCHSLS